MNTQTVNLAAPGKKLGPKGVGHTQKERPHYRPAKGTHAPDDDH